MSPGFVSGPFMPKSVVVDPVDKRQVERLNRPWDGRPIYELHVKGFTKRRGDIEEKRRGTYAGLAAPASIEYLRGLGVTSVELMPVHQFVVDRHLREKGLTNYWGYNSIGFFAPDPRYAAAPPDGAHVAEFREMVRALHDAFGRPGPSELHDVMKSLHRIREATAR